MRSLTITWTLWSHGWAFVKVADDQGEAEVLASYATDGPEQFLYAMARLVLGDEEAHAELEGEPQVYRWFFRRDGAEVDIRLSRPMTPGHRPARAPFSGQVATRLPRSHGRPSALSTGSRTNSAKRPTLPSGAVHFPGTNSKPLRTAMRALGRSSSTPDISG